MKISSSVIAIRLSVLEQKFEHKICQKNGDTVFVRWRLFGGGGGILLSMRAMLSANHLAIVD
jgi:hypothetical protein